MARIEGGSIGRGSGFSGRSLGASSGGVAVAARSSLSSSFGGETGKSIATSFSSRSLGERPSLSFGPSTKPSLSLGQPDRPSLSFAGSRFESKRSITDKSPGSFYTPKFSEARTSFGEPKTRSNGIELSSVIAKSKTDVQVPRVNTVSFGNTSPFTPETPKPQPKGLVTRNHLDNTAPFNPIKEGTKAPASLSRLDAPVSKIVQQFDVAKTAPFAPKTDRQSLPKVDLKPTVIPVKDTDLRSISDKAVRITHRELIVPVKINVGPAIDLRKGKEPILVPKVIERTTVNTEALSHIAARPRVEDILAEEEKKKIKTYEAEQLDTVAKAYVRAGLALNQAEGMRMTERFLGLGPEILAKNIPLAEKVTVIEKNGLTLPNPRLQPVAPELPNPKPLRVLQSAPVGTPEPGSVPQPQRAAIAEAGVAANALTQKDASMLTRTKHDESVRADAKIQSPGATSTDARADVSTEKPSNTRNAVTIFSRTLPTGQSSDSGNPVAFQVDKQAEAARLEEVRNAVDAVFPAFDLSSTVPLDEVARNMTGKSEKSKSRLAKVLGIEDGSEIWRADVRGGNVTRGQAMQTAEWAIVTKPPVDLPADVVEVKEKVSSKDVERVLRGELDQEEYALAA